ncbi:MAG: glycosyltransferase family 2 protein [Desulfarculaceae bacterium]|nr:glycosyltransferase family 2 protein [Desulfarculaceae bacterium]MCF8047885.1 glycosyltransferase family 2 protein [Desulfarculaceae bacterium]MCF8066828.1 glycosyltransferase family 2 protein [Desulfarculaceae bacterium]MCF8096277.1 glycosyltransferase family 2 protein [Desulfarculaceae bacterium]MCF8122494.1 glycosyltransferase family 2 protein [Desulfarculaceae bacterium]
MATLVNPPQAEAVPAVSIIVPVFNEQESIPSLYGGLANLADSLGAEVIVVDDGSDDASPQLLQGCRGFIYLRIPHAGKSAALAAGLAMAKAPITVTIDADLQEDPAQIPELVALVEQGYDCAYGIRVRRQDSFWGKRLPSWIYNRLIWLLFGHQFRDVNCGLRAAPTERLRCFEWTCGTHRLIPLLAHLQGGRVKGVPVRHRSRQWGRSKYATSRRYPVSLRHLLSLRLTGHV